MKVFSRFYFISVIPPILVWMVTIGHTTFQYYTNVINLFVWIRKMYYGSTLILSILIFSSLTLVVLIRCIVKIIKKQKANPLFFTKSIIAVTITALLPLLIYCYATIIEPACLQVRYKTVLCKSLKSEVVIVHISDIQTKSPGLYEKRVIQKIKQENPDILIHTGDLVQPCLQEQHTKVLGSLAELVNTIDAPLGKYHVMGDTDRWRAMRQFSKQSDCTVLVNQGYIATTGDIKIGIFGLSLAASRNGRLNDSGYDTWLKQVDVDVSILAGHAPDYMLSTDGRPIDLCLAGHTHGGQIRLPWIGPIITLSRIPKKWARGLHEIGSIPCNISAGVGAEHAACLPSIRFLCPPEFTVIRLVPTS